MVYHGISTFSHVRGHDIGNDRHYSTNRFKPHDLTKICGPRDLEFRPVRNMTVDVFRRRPFLGAPQCVLCAGNRRCLKPSNQYILNSISDADRSSEHL